jgi:uncharacterized membrane protein HdeD (DUF308 family)
MAGTLSLDAAVAESRAHVEKVVRRNTGLFLVQAVLMIVAGLVALVYPLVTTLAVTLFLGWMLVFSGIVQAITLIANARLPHFWLQLVSAVLSAVVGLLFIRNPGVAVTTLALLLVIYFFVEGIAKVVLAISVRPMPNWGWILVSGIIGLLLGVWLMMNPALSIVFLGVFIGIQLIAEGVAIGWMALGLRKSVT